ncbi:MAG: T9SS type A sorting domain-containing protein, partial [Candidatus Marinimicrobia bacterium]|nr:T9SS type A sorting domain-containing protein [Candidatus Neomarinimicrobiota bacterium]
AGYHPLRFRVTGSAGANHTEEYDLVVMMENLFILLVDDSGEEADEQGRSIISYYREAFTLAGIPYYSPWSRTQDGMPSVSTLSQYRTIVWMTGSSRETLDDIEQANLRVYLDGGGSLFISGQNIGYDLAGPLSSDTDTLFYADYLKSHYERDAPYDDATTILMTGVEGDPISKGFAYPKYFFLSGGASAGNQGSPDIIVPTGGAVGTVEYFGTGLRGKHSGIRYAGEDYRLVYLSFGLEGINDAGNAPITKEGLLGRVIGWLQEDPRILAIEDQPTFVQPQTFALEQNYPNPFNATTTIPYRLVGSGMVELAIFDLLGREVLSVRRTHSGPGRYPYTWQGLDRNGLSVPSGVYLYWLKYKDRISVKKLLLLK